MNYQQERDEFIIAMSKSGVSLDVCRQLMSKAQTIDRLAVAQCNGDWPADNGERKVIPCPECGMCWVPGTIKKGGCPDCRVKARIIKLCNGLPIVPIFDGDPRGYCLKVQLPDGRKIGVPIRVRY